SPLHQPRPLSPPLSLQRFTNEDHLAVHKHKHELTLKFGPARTDSTPTPTRFLKNCEEVGLFNELASSFEHEFKKAAEDDEKKARGCGCPGRDWGRSCGRHGPWARICCPVGSCFWTSGALAAFPADPGLPRADLVVYCSFGFALRKKRGK
uniref:Uncharacterized protein n=1 Tax=Geospiza parvula TaxID=87175 RepID=A0A8U8CFJ9_GEOPR